MKTYEISSDAEKILQHIAKDAGVSAGVVLSEAIALLETVYNDVKLKGFSWIEAD